MPEKNKKAPNKKDPKSSNSKTLGTILTLFAGVIGFIFGWFAVNFIMGAIFGTEAPLPEVQHPVSLNIETVAHQEIIPETLSPTDDELKQKLRGTWSRQEEVKQTLVLQDDGTGTLTVEIDSVIAALFGDKVVMQINWTVEKGRAIFTSLSGEPEMAFNYIKENYGTKRDRKIDSLDEQTLVLLDDLDDNSRSHWKRITSMN
ncbi:MAG: hypothetical protein KDA65_16395 [Planctomycetaceae bacterium]|nr:hypothetical protein [Planctomycetaceae bacterium]